MRCNRWVKGLKAAASAAHCPVEIIHATTLAHTWQLCCCAAVQPDGDHVCIVIPATPNLQQEQQTLWQHQRQHQQQHQQPAHRSTTTSAQQQHQHAYTGPATAANLSPMMLVLRWRSLALVAAPLVSNLGLLALTSSSITLDQADAVVASAVINTAPALAPTAADTVVLAVMRSGWMWAGSLAGSSLNQVRLRHQARQQRSTTWHSLCRRQRFCKAAAWMACLCGAVTGPDSWGACSKVWPSGALCAPDEFCYC
jgi:hypothetical protein